MQRVVFSLLILLCLHWDEVMGYGFETKREGKTPIARLAVYSERCSGSNYIQSLILTNVFGIWFDQSSHKHFPPWLELEPSHYFGPPEHYTFDGSDGMLVVVIFRDPYDWVRSLHSQPWHAARYLHNISFSKFIRLSWRLNHNQGMIARLKRLNPLLDLNPVNGAVFKNILELRTAKIRTMLKIRERAKNVYFINYEVARDHPQEVLNELKELFNLELKPVYKPVVNYKGLLRAGTYQETVYDPISTDDLQHINDHLNEQLENEIGYALHRLPLEIDIQNKENPENQGD